MFLVRVKEGQWLVSLLSVVGISTWHLCIHKIISVCNHYCTVTVVGFQCFNLSSCNNCGFN